MNLRISLSPFASSFKRADAPAFGSLFVITFFVGCLAIGKDYLFSIFKDTGFYISESALYNTIWIFFAPFTLLTYHFLRQISTANKRREILIKILLSFSVSFLHVVIFTSFFTGVSHLVFSPDHRFSAIFTSVLSDEFLIMIIWYAAFIVLYSFRPKKDSISNSSTDRIFVKSLSKTIQVNLAEISYISTDRPYTAVHLTSSRKILTQKSLKQYETELDASNFLRVHRSYIVNKNQIKELKSRSNGDYDCVLNNGSNIRLSRHFRANWAFLLQ